MAEEAARAARKKAAWAGRRQKKKPAPKPEEEYEYEYEEDVVLAEAETEDDGQVTLPLRETPAPQIIDARQRIAPNMEPGAKPFERKKPARHAALSSEGFEDYELPGFDLLGYDEDEETAQFEVIHSSNTKQDIGSYLTDLPGIGIEIIKQSPGRIEAEVKFGYRR